MKSLLAICVPATALLKKQRQYGPRDSAIRRGAHVLLCSHLEGFFEDLVSNIVDAYDRLADGVGRLPTELWACQVLGSPSRWEERDPSKRWESVKTWATHQLMKPAPGIPFRCMEAELHTKGFANPGTGEVEALFKTVGISGVWDRFRRIEPDRVYMNSINVIVNRRNEIAHGKLDASITLDDVQLYVQRAERVASVFEQLVFAEVNGRLAVRDCWQALEQSPP